MIDYKSRIQAMCASECPHYAECKTGIDENKYEAKFKNNGTNGARVGPRYGEDGSIPKIVMVGLESLKGDVPGSPPSIDAPNQHYRGVKYVLAYLLADFMGKKKPEPKVTRDGVEWIKDALSRYCLCNLYRCAFVPKENLTKRSGLPHTEGMKKNCIHRLPEEIKALDPDVVVVQVTDSKVFPDENMEKLLSEFSCGEARYDKGKRARLYTGSLNGHAIHIAQTLHGASRRPSFSRHEYLENDLNPMLDEIIRLLKQDRSV